MIFVYGQSVESALGYLHDQHVRIHVPVGGLRREAHCLVLPLQVSERAALSGNMDAYVEELHCTVEALTESKVRRLPRCTSGGTHTHGHRAAAAGTTGLPPDCHLANHTKGQCVAPPPELWLPALHTAQNKLQTYMLEQISAFKSKLKHAEEENRQLQLALSSVRANSPGRGAAHRAMSPARPYVESGLAARAVAATSAALRVRCRA